MGREEKLSGAHVALATLEGELARLEPLLRKYARVGDK